MRLGLIINCMGQTAQTNHELEIEYIENIEPLLQDMGFDVHTIFPNADWLYAAFKSHELKNDFSTYQDKKEMKKRLNRNNKGVVVSECLLRFKELNREIILHIDGSKRFKLTSILDVVKNFLETSIDAVLTIRRNNSGMTKPRELIEDFERFAITNYFDNTDVPDGQSGCWAFRCNENICITAMGYEIELDILTELLKFDANICWIDIIVNIIDTAPSQVDYLPDSIEKIKFVCNKLKIKKSILMLWLEEFCRLHSQRIVDIDNEEIKNGNDKLFSTYKAEIEKFELLWN